MADVLIRGIEMPPNVEGCEVILRIQPNGEVLDIHKIHTGVTAIPLPERHGRLKDSDEIISAIKGKFCYGCLCPPTSYNCQLCKITKIVEMVSDASTIIEAEGGTDDGNE